MTKKGIDKPEMTQGRKPFTIVFVCTANICRSPMAEGILKFRVASPECAEDIKVLSAGVAAVNGHKASALAEEVCLDAGINISRHASRPVTRRLLKSADVVLAMTPEQKTEMEMLYPEFRGKIFLLGEYGRKRRGKVARAIDDPYNGTKEDYEIGFMRLQREIQRILPILKEEAINKCKVQNEKCKMQGLA